jgi:transcriptional regulator with GAF, ATPase, and Fis domain
VGPTLLAVTGPLAESVLPLAGDEVSIGRDASNAVALADASVSRNHSLLRRDGTTYCVLDLDSRNGTLVNGIPVRDPRPLQSGDRIEIGTSMFVFYETEAAARSGTADVEDADTDLRTTVRLDRRDAVYLKPGPVAAGLRPPEVVARETGLLLEAGRLIATGRSVRDLADALLRLVIEGLGADRAALVVVREGAEEPALTVGRTRTPECGPVKVSRTVLERVLREGHAVSAAAGPGSDTIDPTASLLDARVCSFVAAPLLAAERTIGVLYADRCNAGPRFGEDALQLLMGLSGMAGGAVANLRHLEWLRCERNRVEADLGLDVGLVGESAGMRGVLDFVARVAPTDATVLLQGESGTGKELVARALHRASPRAGAAFVAVACPALSETLLESELFGHEKGAFTGATERKTGRIELAHRGTLFLDEVADLALPLQAKLLRVLQEREFERVGGTRPIKVDVRLVAATNLPLADAVRAGAFRDDLFYRLNVVSLQLPSLRERRDDIPVLAAHFAGRFARTLGKPFAGIAPEARAALMAYEWPGNVRELANAIERALVLGRGDVLRREDLPETVSSSPLPSSEGRGRYHDTLEDAKKRLIVRALEECHGNYTHAARWLGLNANYLHRLIRVLGIKDALKR